MCGTKRKKICIFSELKCTRLLLTTSAPVIFSGSTSNEANNGSHMAGSGTATSGHRPTVNTIWHSPADSAGGGGPLIPARSDEVDIPPGSTSVSDMEVDGDNVPRWPTGPSVPYGPSWPAGSESDEDNVPQKPTGLPGIAGGSIPARSDDGNVPPGSTSIAGSKVDEGNVPRWPTRPPVTDWPTGPAGSETDGGNVPHQPTRPTGIAGGSIPRGRMAATSLQGPPVTSA